MHRRTATIDDKAFEAFDAVLDDGFCICAIVTDGNGRPVDYRYLRVNRRFEEQTGVSGVEGRTALEAVPDLERKWIDLFGRVALDREPARVVDDSPALGRSFEVFAAPVDPPGCFVIHFRDVTPLHRLAAERQDALDQSRRVFQELHHRVMNSFAAIGAIVAMEARAAAPEARGALERVGGRVQALGALYRRLDAGAVDRVDLRDYLGGNIDSFARSLAAPDAGTIESDIAPLVVPTRAAVPIALIVNELLTSAAKHGDGAARVSLHEKDGRVSLVVADGAPLLDGADEPADGRGGGLGHGLVRAFVAELGGDFRLEEGDGRARAVVTFPTPEPPPDAPSGAPLVDAAAPML